MKEQELPEAKPEKQETEIKAEQKPKVPPPPDRSFPMSCSTFIGP